MIDWIKKAQEVAAITGALGNGTWGYIVATYDKDTGPNNQRLYLNGARVAQMGDTAAISLNSDPLASDGT